MQGWRSAIGSLPDSVNFDYGSPSTNVSLDQQICWNNHRNPPESRLPNYRISASNSDNMCVGSVGQEGTNLGRWNVGESSTSSAQNLLSHDEQLTLSGWSPPMNSSVRVGSRLDDLQYVPSNVVTRPGVDLNLRSNQIITGPAFVRRSISSSASQNIDLNEGHFDRAGDDVDCFNSSNSSGVESKLHPAAGSSSDAFDSSSGSVGFLVGNDDGRNPSCSLDGRRLSCKRKTHEGNVGQSSSGGCCSTSAEGSMWRSIPSHFNTGSSLSIVATPEISSNINHLSEQVNPRLGLDMSGRVPGDNIRSLNVPGGPENSRRNDGLRMSPSIQQDSMSNNLFLPVPTSVTRHPDITSLQHSLGAAPINPPFDLVPPISHETSAPQNQSIVLRASTIRRNVPSHRRNNLRPTSSSSSGLSGERDNVMPDDSSSRNPPRNIGEHAMLSPIVEARSLSSHPTNWSLSEGNVGTSRNTASSSRLGSNAGSLSSVEPSGASHRLPPSQYSRRMTDYVRRSLLSTVGSDIANQISSNNQHSSIPSSSQDGAPGEPSGASHRLPPSHYSRRMTDYVRRSLLSTAGSDIASQISSNNQRSSVPASSQDGAPGEPSGTSHRHPPSQYSRRMSDYVRRSLLSTVGSDVASQISSNNQRSSVPASSQDGASSSSGGIQELNHSHSRSASWMERQGHSPGGIPYLRALVAAGEGRSRLVSEIRSALNIIRRGEELQIEDLMMLNQSGFFGMADTHDQHRDMRLDVDNMSYEELLALEDRIGNVCTGVSEDTIIKCMKQHKHVHTMSDDQTEPEPCCVCQEIYRDGEDIGTLDCGHDFHRECITQWLSQKNLCPICKTTGLALRN